MQTPIIISLPLSHLPLSRCQSIPVTRTHYCDVIMGAVASQITNLTIVYSTVYSDADQRKHQSSASLAFVWGIQRGPVNSRHKWPVTQIMFPFDDVIMKTYDLCIKHLHYIRNRFHSERANRRQWLYGPNPDPGIINWHSIYTHKSRGP